jgi:hypothetical protein
MFLKQNLIAANAALGGARNMLLVPSRRNFGGAIVKAEGGHKFVAPCNKKTIAFDGLKPSSNVVVEINNPYRHQNDLPLLK